MFPGWFFHWVGWTYAHKRRRGAFKTVTGERREGGFRSRSKVLGLLGGHCYCLHACHPNKFPPHGIWMIYMVWKRLGVFEMLWHLASMLLQNDRPDTQEALAKWGTADHEKSNVSFSPLKCTQFSFIGPLGPGPAPFTETKHVLRIQKQTSHKV